MLDLPNWGCCVTPTDHIDRDAVASLLQQLHAISILNYYGKYNIGCKHWSEIPFMLNCKA